MIIRDDLEVIKDKIREAFANVQYPGDANIVSSTYDDEGVSAAFRGITDWRNLTPAIINRQSEALTFFSCEARQFYLPACLLADLDGKLTNVDLLFSLTHGFTDDSKDVQVKVAQIFRPAGEPSKINFELAAKRFELFNVSQAAAIVTYLTYKSKIDVIERRDIEESLLNFWWIRAGMRPIK